MESPLTAENWLQLHGRWNLQGETIRYLGGPSDRPLGLVISKLRARNGRVEVKVKFPSPSVEREARLVYRCDVGTEEYFAAGLGGWNYAYSMHYGRGARALTVLAGTGDRDALLAKDDYNLEVQLSGGLVLFRVDGNEVFREILPRDLSGQRVGLFSFGSQPVEFSALRLVGYKPKAFVIMQFGEPFDLLYTSVIAEAARQAGFDVDRADRTLGPGVILSDIVSKIVNADVVIAQLSFSSEKGFNPNVFYELGYAHALTKPTLMLVDDATKPPFDISHMRQIRYRNTPDGLHELREQLDGHLRASISDLSSSLS
jgi:hypothetical protein